jgi:DNA-binding LacI/PurR family transcriptional regulator
MYRREPGVNEWDYVPASELVYTMDGIILAGLYNFDYVTSFTRLEIDSLISYDVDASVLGIDSIFMDDLQSSFDMTNTLFKRGHKKIAYIGRDLRGANPKVPADPCVFAREDGYRLALSSRKNIKPLVYNSLNRSGYEETLTNIFNEHPDLTGVICESPFKHDAFTKRGVELATWASKVKADNGLSDQVTLVAACDFIKMGDIALDLLFDSIRGSRKGVKRVKIQPEIRELK